VTRRQILIAERFSGDDFNQIENMSIEYVEKDGLDSTGRISELGTISSVSSNTVSSKIFSSKINYERPFLHNPLFNKWFIHCRPIISILMIIGVVL
jgi:hypothetical protein